MGKIYRITCNLTKQNYYGSTFYPLQATLARHVSCFKAWLKKKEHAHYIPSYEILKNGNYKIVLLENYPCNSREELSAREREYIENNECVNKVIPKYLADMADNAYAFFKDFQYQKMVDDLAKINKDHQDMMNRHKQMYGSNK